MAEGYRLTDERWCWQRVTVRLPDDSRRTLIIKYDAVDARLVEKYTWYAKADYQRFYAATTTEPRDETGWRPYVSMHALIMGPAQEGRIAHLNGNGLDNRRANLKRMTQQEILAKRRPAGGASRYKGVCWDRDQQKWLVAFRGKKVGRFRDEEEAARAFDEVAFAHWGEGAYLNFPREQAS